MPTENLPGTPLLRSSAPYNFEGHRKHYGNGTNMLRTERLAQPKALKIGDMLATGDRVLSEPREGGNGSVFIHLTGGFDGHWIDVPARIPIALITKADDEETWKSHITSMQTEHDRVDSSKEITLPQD